MEELPAVKGVIELGQWFNKTKAVGEQTQDSERDGTSKRE